MLKPIGGSDNQPVEPSNSQNSVTPQPQPHQQASRTAAPAPSAPMAPPTGYRAPVYEPESTSKAPLIISISAAVLIVGGGAFWLFKPEGKPTLPVAWSSFSAADGTFSCDTPDGWSVNGTGKANAGGTKMSEDNGVRMDSGGAHVEVSMSSVGGLLTKQLLFGKEITPEAMTGSRANGVFTSQKSGMKKRFSELKEVSIPAPESKFASIDAGSFAGLTGATGGSNSSAEELKEMKDLKELFKPDIRIVEFTGKKTGLGMGKPVKGIRATLGGRELIASVVCFCPPGDYDALKPSFLRIIGSVSETRKTDGSMRLNAPGFSGMTLPGNPPRQ